jgi:hypothetical protein
MPRARAPTSQKLPPLFEISATDVSLVNPLPGESLVMKRLLCVALALLVCSLDSLVAWGTAGHRIVGRIAASFLTREAREKVAEILEVEPTVRELGDALADAAEWPDTVARTKFPQSSEWHFIDLGVKPNRVKDDALWENDSTAFAKIVKFFGTVKRGDPDELAPASDLNFIAHLIGDIHQPLHAATNKDRGGNCLFVTFTTDEGTSGRIKFHTVMDRSILEERLGTNDRLIARRMVRDSKAMIEAEIRTARSRLSSDVEKTVRGWIEESHDLAVDRLYGTLRPVVPRFESVDVRSDCSNAARQFKDRTWELGDSGTDRHAELIEHQLLIAGARLAALLNEISE